MSPKRARSLKVGAEFDMRGVGKWPEQKYTPEQIIGILRQVEVAMSNGPEHGPATLGQR
jgi:hypothetical protein